MGDESQSQAFENSVRRIARELWAATYAGAAMVDGRERDLVFETDDVIYVVEATTDRSKAKAAHDVQKLLEFRRVHARRGKVISCWFVTQSEPTADQRSVAPKDSTVNVLSFDQFRSKLVRAADYLAARAAYEFGSARDPRTGSSSVGDRYYPLELARVGVGSRQAANVSTLLDLMASGGRLVVLGDYGAGKSMTLRELFRQLSNRFQRGQSPRFPLHLNLRDHHGQTHPDEAIERHGRSVGIGEPHRLVHAWRAGFTDLILDGFDELAMYGWGIRTRRLHDYRHGTMRLVRNLISQTPPESAVVVAGRPYFFDTLDELRGALELRSDAVMFRIEPLTTEQVAGFLRRQGWDKTLPGWFPARPLLLAHLADRELLDQVSAVPIGSDPAAAWHHFLTVICEREAQIQQFLNGDTIRQVLERLASVLRERSNALGEITFEDLERSFAEVCGYEPDAEAATVLSRLPGLGQTGTNTRKFIDDDLEGAAAAGDLVRFAHDPYSSPSRAWRVQLGQLAIAVAAHRLAADGRSGIVLPAVAQAASLKNASPLVMDLVRVLTQTELTSSLPCPLTVSEVWTPELDLEDNTLDLSNLMIHDAVIQSLHLPAGDEADVLLPRFVRCHFGSVNGRTSAKELPDGRFEQCSFDTFLDDSRTTSGIMALPLPMGVRVALTILKKLYAQKGSGRKEQALYRGLDPSRHEFVRRVLEALGREPLLVRGKIGNQVMWWPIPTARARVSAIPEAPLTSRDPVLDDLARL